MRKLIKLELTQDQAEQLGIVSCSCGHPPNNHFEFYTSPTSGKMLYPGQGKGSCAHCKCSKYDQQICLPPKKKPASKPYDQG